MRRSLTSRTASPPLSDAILLPHPRVERVSQAVAEHVKGEHEQAEDERRVEQQVRVEAHLPRAVADKGPERSVGHLDAEANKAQDRLVEDRARHREHHRDYYDAQRVRD